MPGSTTRRGDDGFAAIELALGIATILAPLAIALMLLPQWPERQAVARGVAKEAAITMANASSAKSGEARALQLVMEAEQNHGLPAGSIELRWSGEWCRGCSITATVTVVVPALNVPIVGSTGSFAWSTSSTQRIADFRSIG